MYPVSGPREVCTCICTAIDGSSLLYFVLLPDNLRQCIVAMHELSPRRSMLLHTPHPPSPMHPEFSILHLNLELDVIAMDSQIL